MKETKASELCKVVSVIFLIVGILGAFLIAWQFGVTSTMGYKTVHYERSWILTISLFLGTFFTSFVFFSFFISLSEHLERIAWITEKMGYSENGFTKEETQEMNDFIVKLSEINNTK